MKQQSKKIIWQIALVFIAISLCVAAGTLVFADRQYLAVSAVIAALSCVVFYLSFEGRTHSTKRLVVVAAMTALSAAGRFFFAPIPFFKPVTAIVIICGMHLGCEAGFICGSMSAFLSNFLFMQGPWTPFQMFIWGAIGFISGLLSKPLRGSRALLLLWGGLAGVLYSAFMDVWTAVWYDGTLVLSRYGAAVAAAIPITIVYIISNIIFLLILADPIGKKLERLHKKYGV